MKKFTTVISLLLAFTALSIFYSCQLTGGVPTYNTYISIKIDGSEYTADSNAYNFGFADPADSGKDVSLLISNKTDTPVKITGIASSEPAFTYSGVTIPVELSAGEETELTVTFTPASSATYSSEVTISTDKGDFKVNLTGEGNYTPGFDESYTVSNSGNDGDPGYDGIYSLDTSAGLFNGKPVYKKPAPKSAAVPSDYYLFYFDTGEGMYWAIDADLNSANPYYRNFTAAAEIPPEENWKYYGDGYIQSGFEFSRNPWITGVIDYDSEPPIATFTAHYTYTDTEGDEEDTVKTLYQWYRYNSDSGTFTKLDSETSATYTADFIDTITVKVEVKVYSKTGFTEGTTVTSYSYTELMIQPS